MSSYVAKRSLACRRQPRRGVILLVVMVLLALLTMLGLTIVLTTAQGRLSALAAARATLNSEHDESAMYDVFSQVVTGSNDPNSVFGAHGLLEDMYGLPQFFGQIAIPQAPSGAVPYVLPLGTTQSNFGSGPVLSGSLMRFTITATQTPNPLIVVTNNPQQFYQPLPIYSGAFCGQVITMLTGNAAGESARVVGYTYEPLNQGGTPWAYIETSSFGGRVPNVGDHFMINGRPYSGTGFGFDLTQFQTNNAPPWKRSVGNLPLLTAPEVYGTSPSGLPYAYLPNHSKIGLSIYNPAPNPTNPTPGPYWDKAGPGQANEAYDAPDFQNMMLAMHYWDLTSGPTGTGAVITPIPSLHRPELIAWWYNYLLSQKIPGGISTSPNALAIRRKMLLRPEPTDHYFIDSNANGVWDAREPFYDFDGDGFYTVNVDPFLDLNGDGVLSSGETDYSGNTFNPITGGWYIAKNGAWKPDPRGSAGLDVDNDNDGIADSIWVDAGLAAQKSSDGKWYKYLAAILCIDLDGKLNLNATGSLAQVDVTRYSGNNILGPFAGQAGFAAAYNTTTSQRNIPVGLGHGPADINLAPLFVRTHGTNATGYYQVFLQGAAYPGAVAPIPQYVDGRYGESTRLNFYGNPSYPYPGIYPPGSMTNSAVPPLSATQRIFSGPRPGSSFWYDPFLTATIGNLGLNGPFDWVNNPVSLARFSDFRPGLLNPKSLASVPFFFDFLNGANNFATALLPPVHVPTAHGTPSDLLSRGFVAVDIRGRPYYAGTATVPWIAVGTNWSSTMMDYGVSQYSLGGQSWLAQEVTENEIVNSPYTLDLTRNADHEGRNSGNNGTSNSLSADFPTIENPLSPTEGEALLRSHDSDAAQSLGRLNNIETAFTYMQNQLAGVSGPTSVVPTKLAADNIRLSTATETWDLPVPNVVPTPGQMQDLITYQDYLVSSYPANTTQTLNFNNLSVADLARARIYVENVTNPISPFSQPVPLNLPSTADTAIFGNLKNTQQNVLVFPTANPTPYKPVWPLLAPETLLGMRLDINRLLGNGQDDNGNGVVDEPAEAFYANPLGSTNYTGEYMQYPTSVVNGITKVNSIVEWLDLNNDGFLPTTNPAGAGVLIDQQTSTAPLGDPTLADMRARQLLARHLYVMAMLMLDDRSMPGNIAAQIFNSTNPAQLPLPWPQYQLLTPREQAAYVVAQWAVNVVDFRDRDAIMTPFEFDLYPFHADDPSNPLATWNVDDIVAPWMPGGNPISLDDTTPLPNTFNPANTSGIRGLVWGCERPELLITETLAIHDRGTADTSQGQDLTMPSAGPDTVIGQGGPPSDNDDDQVRRPRGTLLFELFNATSHWDAPQYDLMFEQVAQNGGFTQPWADSNGNVGYGVNLAQIAGASLPPTSGPLGPNGPSMSPVWRVAVAYSPFIDETAFYTNSPGIGKLPDPRAPVLPAPVLGQAGKSYIHRVAYFTPYQPAFTTTNANGVMVGDVSVTQSFFCDPDIFLGFDNAASTNRAAIWLPPSQYALVGPAAADANGVDTIYIGQNPGGGGSPAYANVRKLQLGIEWNNGGGFPVNPNSGTIAMYSGAAGGIGPYGAGYSQVATVPSQTIKQVIGVPLQANWLANSGNTATYVPHSQANTAGMASVATTLRFSVSEPEHGYPVWPAGSNTAASLADDVAYYSTTVGTPTTTKFPQHPFDSPGVVNPQTGNSYLQFNDKPNTYVAPDGNTSTNIPVMTPSYTVIYLQRLANPLAPWDATANPYITVDSMPVDLTAYTGEPSVATSKTKGEPKYSSGVPQNSLTAFDSRRRGYDALGNVIGTTQLVANVWTPLPVNVQLTSGYGVAAGQGTLGAPLPDATLGYLNNEYGTYYSLKNPAPVNNSGVAASNYYGDPMIPMPWITWNDRPFASQYELMLVPASSPSSLASDFGMLGWQSMGGSPVNEYLPITPATPVKPQQLPVAQFEHLLNFFDSQTPAQTISPTTGGGPTYLRYLPNLYRLFEYVHTPSLFAGTQEMMNPTMFTGDHASPVGTASHLFHTPFNWLSRYREPGRVNLNTIFDPVVFQSLTDDYPGNGAFGNTFGLWFDLLNSRSGYAGYTTVAPNPLVLWGANALGQTPAITNPAYTVNPSYFVNPFRPDGSNAFVPPTSWSAGAPQAVGSMNAWDYPPPSGVNASNLAVNVTLMRPSPVNVNVALFDDTAFDPNNSARAGVLPTSATTGATYNSGNLTPYRNAGRDPYFQYQMFQRLGNTTTNRSNVYAIWITLGKFQVQPVAVDDTHPDGFKLIGPALDPTGTQQKQRGFYIFDRSIPVGFQRGESTNIDRAILLERIIPQ